MTSPVVDALAERGATETDYESLYQLHVDTMRDYVAATYGWDDDVQRQMFKESWDKNRAQRVYIEHGAIVATWLFEHRVADVYLAFIEVASSHQGRGIGSRVIGGLLAQATKAGLPATLMVMKENPRARRLYERLGFRSVRETATHHEMAKAALSGAHAV